MQILRIPPYPLYATYTVPEANKEYIVSLENTPRTIEIEIVVTSNEDSEITFELNGETVKYDHNYSVIIYESDDGNYGDIVIEDILNIMRPYVDPNTLGSSPQEIAQYVEYEQLARGLVDSVIGPKGFMFEKAIMEVVGDGTDYLPLWDRGYKILQVYENGDLVYDADQNPPYLGEFMYGITQDKSAIYKEYVPVTTNFNRAEKRPRKLPRGASDSFRGNVPIDSSNQILYDQPVMFPEGYDYVVVFEAGWKVIPHDVQDATMRLIEDIKCGKLDYAKQYITNYSTDQYNITFDTSMFQGTGNNYVDRILQKYIVSIYKPRVI